MPLSPPLDVALSRALAAPAPFAHAVATDADGTLWASDVGDALFLEVARRDDFRGEGLAILRAQGRRLLGDRAPEAPPALARALYHAYALGRVDVATMCALEALSVGDRDQDEFDTLITEVAASAASTVRHEIVDLLHRARDAGTSVHVVTGSLGVLVEATLRFAGLPFDTISGAVLRRAGTRVTAEIETPAPLFDGKVDALRRTGAWPAALGLGDSVWDQTFLREVYVPVLVYPKPALCDAMRDIEHALRVG